MKINQAFDILARYGGIRAARIITDNAQTMPYWRVALYAWKLRHGVPVAKIIHKKWFFGLAFYTDKYTLDPRPDTETLVAAVLSDIGTDNYANILDIGTGTGCVIASIVKNTYNTTGVGGDVSWRARRIARRNIRTLDLENRVRIVPFNFNRHNQKSKIANQQFDIIVSNPPYIAFGDTRVNAAAMHDPKLALYAGNDAYAAYKNIAHNAKKLLRRNGMLYLEIGIDMENNVRDIFSRAGWRFVRSEQDLGGVERVLVFSIQ